jgi:hypothetical protein
VDRADPDLFARGRKPLCVARCILTIATGRGEALHNLDVAQQYLADRPEVCQRQPKTDQLAASEN